ncbi:MAG TPA: CoA pyrophosphatase [Rhizomicrobium sp.]|nr:CoA pyrophosphatase [Rhizomicrobium sp.]
MRARMKMLVEDPLAALRAALPQAPSDQIGRDEYAAFPEMRAPGQTAPSPAAVLIPIIARDLSQGGPTILFTRRTEHLVRHSGQISFPGGRREAQDLSPVETALRETREETGIDPAYVSIAGFLPRYLTGTGFDIAPVVGLVAPGFALVPDTREVAEIFEVKLAFFLDPANAKSISREMAGRARVVHVFEPEGRYIWGITAALLIDFTARLRAGHDIKMP